MKRTTVLFAFSTLLFAAGSLMAADQPKIPIPSTTPPAQQQKLYKIATLPTAKDNTDFQSNVQYMQAQRQKTLELNTAMEKEKDPKKKEELKKQYDAAFAKLNEDNEKMIKVYGFSLARSYIMEIERANVYLVLTPEEAAKVDAEEKAAAAAKK
jgi:hypothetical protein